ncbi:DUF192 domain-containing protein [Robiginitalea myxolifaciens]|nr:DUF192 domain-containing protein [Robiginitalea myxolifaciens]
MSFALGVILLSSCKDKPQKLEESAKEVSFSKEGELQVFYRESDSLLAEIAIEIADSEYETQTGLMYRREMKDTQGMLFIFQEEAYHSFYMKNTLIALDLLFIDADMQVVTIAKNAQPYDETGIPSRVPVQYVLEIKAGLSDRLGISEGDRIAFQRIP